MAQETVSIESSETINTSAQRSRGGGLKWKLGMAFGGLILVLGIAVIGIVYYFAGSALQKQFDLRAAIIAATLSDTSAGYVSTKSALELDALTAKYGRLDGVAYAYIQAPTGEILASSIQPFPSELKEGGGSSSASRVTQLRGQGVFETRAPVLDGQLGSVHIGFWAQSIQDDIQAAVVPILGLIAVCVVVSLVFAIMLAIKTIRPILKLKSIAGDISRGHLDTSVVIQSNDEVGEIARSLERMRASLVAAMSRLNRQ
jgi:HAMP domain-containing protein